jgi:hypothetical protein
MCAEKRPGARARNTARWRVREAIHGGQTKRVPEELIEGNDRSLAQAGAE